MESVGVVGVKLQRIVRDRMGKAQQFRKTEQHEEVVLFCVAFIRRLPVGCDQDRFIEGDGFLKEPRDLLVKSHPAIRIRRTAAERMRLPVRQAVDRTIERLEGPQGSTS